MSLILGIGERENSVPNISLCVKHFKTYQIIVNSILKTYHDTRVNVKVSTILNEKYIRLPPI